jgi:hypothetical protein
MTTEARHPSTLELDLHFASGKARSDELARHLAGCDPCRRYLDALESLDAVPPRPLPAPPPRTGARASVWRRVATAGGLALAAGAAVFVALGRGGGDPGYVGVKAAPAVQVLVHAAGGTRIWDGRSPLRPGDALALRVACEGFAQVAVVTPAAPEGGLRQVFAGACPAGSAPLPFRLTVDDAPGVEAVTVVLSAEALDDRALAAAAANAPRTKAVWVLPLVFAKVGGRR